MKLRSTLLFAAASLTAPALLPVAATTAAAFFAAAVPAAALNSTTTEYNGTTYSGDIYKITNTASTSGLAGLTAEKYDSATGGFSGTYGGGVSYGGTGWLASNVTDGDHVGNTLLLDAATSADSALSYKFDWGNYVWIGGLITEGEGSYTIGRTTSNENTNIKLAGTEGVNMNIGADTTISAAAGTASGYGTISIESGGNWVVASGKTLTLATARGINVADGVSISISGGGTVTMGATTIAGDTTIAVSDSSTLTMGNITISGGSGTITYDGLSAGGAASDTLQTSFDFITVEDGSTLTTGTVTLASGFTGTVEIKNSTKSLDLSLANYGVAGSTLFVDNVSNAWLNNATLAADLVIGDSGLSVSNGSSNSGQTGVFAGSVSGAGDITFSFAQGGGYRFEGDLTGYSGDITVSTTFSNSGALTFGTGAEYASSATVKTDEDGSRIIENITGSGAISVSTSSALTFNYASSDSYDVLVLGNSSITSSGTVTFTGGATYLLDLGTTEYSASATTVSAGTLLIGGGADGAEKTLSSDVTVASGAGFGKSGSGALTLAGEVTLSGGAIFDLTGITLSETEAAFKASGTVSFGTTETTEGEGDDAVTVTTKVTVALGGDSLLAGTYKIFDLGNTGLLEGWGELTKDDFTLGGNAITSSRVTITTDAQEGTFTVTGGVYSDMTWNGGASGTWDEATANWRSNQSGSTRNIAFASGDSVIFSTAGANVTLGASISVNKVTVNADTTFTVPTAAEGETQLTLTANTIEISSGTLTLAGGLENYTWGSATVSEGATLDLGGTASAFSKSVSGTGTVKVASTAAGHSVWVDLGTDFAGTLDFTGKLNTGSAILRNASATVALTSGSNVGSLWGGTAATILADVLFKTDYQIGDSTATTITFDGDISAASGTTVLVNGATATLNGTSNFANLRQTGGTINIAGLTTATQFVGTSTGTTAGTLNILSGGVLTITGSSNSTNGNAGSFQLAHWGATQTVNVSGALNLQNAGISNKDGNGDINVLSGGEVNFNTGLVVADSNSNAGVIRVHLSDGGRINIGSGGITDSTVLTLNLNGGTIGSLADSWSTARNLTIGGNVTLDLTKMDFNAEGYAVATDSGSNVEFTGDLSGSGTLTLKNDGASGGLLTITSSSYETHDFSGTIVVGTGTTVQLNNVNIGSSAHNAKIFVADGGSLRMNFPRPDSSTYGDTRSFNADFYLADGSTLGSMDGASGGVIAASLVGNIVFGATDTTGAYSEDSTVTFTQTWGKVVELAGTLSGAGTVRLTNPTIEANAVYVISGSNNTFSGTYELVVSSGENHTSTLALTSQAAAQTARINLSSSGAALKLGAENVTVAGLDGVSGGSVGLYDGTTASTLTINGGGVFAGTFASGVSVVKTGTDTLTLAGATLADGSLTISGGAVSLGTVNAETESLTIDGSLTISGGSLLIDLGDYTSGTYKLLSATGLSADAFSYGTDGNVLFTETLGGRSTVTFAVTDDVLTLTYSANNLNLTWAGGSDGKWIIGSGWTNVADNSAAEFQTWDSVTFNTADAQVTFGDDKNLRVESMTISAATTFTETDAAKGVTVSANTLTVNADATFTGAGLTLAVDYADLTIASGSTLTIDDGATLVFGSGTSALGTKDSRLALAGNGIVKYTFDKDVGDGSGIHIADAFTGTVDWTGNFNWADYGQAGDAHLTVNSAVTLRFSSQEGASTQNALWGYSSATIANDIEFGTDYGINLDSGSLTLNGSVNAEGKTLSIFGGHTLTFGDTATIGTVEMGTVTLDGGTTGITVGTLKYGYNTTKAANTATIQGKVSVTGNVQQTSTGQADGEVISLADGAEMTVGGTFGTTSEDAYDLNQVRVVLNLGEGASLTAADIANANDLDVTLGANAKLTATTALTLNSVWGNKEDHTFTGAGADSSTISAEAIALKHTVTGQNGNASTRLAVSGARLEVGSGGITGADDGKSALSLTDVTLGVREGATSWSSNVDTTLAGTTGAEVGTGQSITLDGVLSGTDVTLTKTGAGTLTLGGANTFTGGVEITDGTVSVSTEANLGAGTVEIGESGTLAFTVSSAQTLSDGKYSGTGTLSVTGTGSAGEVSFGANEFSGSFELSGAAFTLTATNSAGTYADLTLADGATFLAEADVVFSGSVSGTGTLSGASSKTRISVAEGSFSGALDDVSLVKTGAGTLNLAGMTFSGNAEVVAESGTISNLTLGDGATLSIEPSEEGVTLSGLILDGGVIAFNELSTDSAAATLTGGAWTLDSSVDLDFGDSNISVNTEYQLFVFDEASKAAWTTAFGELETNGSGFDSNVTVVGSNLVFYWGGADGLTLYVKQTGEPENLSWWEGGDGTWNKSADNKVWKNGSGDLVGYSDAYVVFNEDSMEGRNSVTVTVAPESGSLQAASLTIDVGAGNTLKFSGEDGVAYLRVSDSANGIVVTSGTLQWDMPEFINREQGYDGKFSIGENGALEVVRAEYELTNELSGEGTILYAQDGGELTLSGDRSAFTGTLRVDAGTVVLANGTGTETLNIALGENGAAEIFGPSGSGNRTATLSGALSGAGTLIVSDGDSLVESSFFRLDVQNGDAFTGTVELRNVHLAAATALFADGSSGLAASTFGGATLIRLNNSSLNFTNRGATFDKNIEIAEGSQGYVRVYGNNTTANGAGVTISGDVSGAGKLYVKDGGEVAFTGAFRDLGEIEVWGGGSHTTISSFTGTDFSVTGNVQISGASTKISYENANIGGDLITMTSIALTVGGSLNVAGDANLSEGGAVSLEDGANFSVAGTATMPSVGGSLTLGAGATLSAGTLSAQSSVISGAGADSSTLLADTLGSVASSFSDLTLRLGDGGIAEDSEAVVLKDVTVGAKSNSSGWTGGANLLLNGGTTTFDVDAGKTISLTGTISEAQPEASGTAGEDDYVAATSSALVKTGTGTLTLSQANTNAGGTTVEAGTLAYALADGTTVSGLSVGVGAESTLAFTSESTGTVTLGDGVSLNFEDGGILFVGARETVVVESGAALSGDVIVESGGESTASKGVLSFAAETEMTGSLTLSSGAKVSIEDEASLTVSVLNFRNGGNATITGDGLLLLDGGVTTDQGSSYVIDADRIGLTGDTDFSIEKGSTLTVRSFASSSNDGAGTTLTKTGAGRLAFESSVLESFAGDIVVNAGTLSSGPALTGFSSLTVTGSGSTLTAGVNRSGTASVTVTDGARLTGDVDLSGGEDMTFTLNASAIVSGNVTLTGTSSADGERVSAEFGTATLSGNLTVENATLNFSGTLSGVQVLTWNDGNKVTLSDSFRKSISESATLIDFTSQVGLADAALEDVFTDDEVYGRRQLHLIYNSSNTSLDVLATGTLVWNSDVTLWESGNASNDDWDFTNKDGSAAKTYFIANDYVEFRDGGKLAIKADEEIRTSGIVFDLGPDDSFSLTANGDNGANLADATVGENAGLTVLSGSVTIADGVHNKLTGGTFVYGGQLIVAGADADALGNGKVVLGDASSPLVNATLSLTFYNDDGPIGNTTIDNQFYIGNGRATISVGNSGTVALSKAILRDSVEVTGEDGLTTSERAETTGLTKTGAGTLSILRGSDLDLLTVSAGTVILSGDGSMTLGVKDATVASGATLTVEHGSTGSGEGSRFGTVTLSGGTLRVGDGLFNAEAIRSSGDSRLSGSLWLAREQTLNIDVGDGGALAFTGSVSGYAGSVLEKSGAGTLTLASSSASTAFSLATDFVQSGGTVSFSNRADVSGKYTVAANSGATILLGNAGNVSGGSLFSGDMTFEAGSQTAISFSQTSTSGERKGLTVTGDISSGAGALVSFSSVDYSGYYVSLNAENIAFGELAQSGTTWIGGLSIGGRSSRLGAVYVTAESDTFSAGGVYIGAGSSLTLRGQGATGATAEAITVESDVVSGGNVHTATLNLSDGTTLHLGNDKGVSVLNGTGTLKVIGGTLSVKGYSDSGPTIELNGATFDFEVTEDDEIAYSTLQSITTAEGSTGTVSKSGAGTLVLAATSGDIAFDGTVALKEGTTALNSTMSNAEVTVAEGAVLQFHSEASASGLAETLSGAGTLDIQGRLTTEDMSSFSGFSGTISASSVGEIVASDALDDWLNDDASRTLSVTDNGWITAANDDVTLTKVSLKSGGENEGFLSGGAGSLNVGTVSADAGTTLVLTGTGTLGKLSFAGEDETNSLVTGYLADWTLTDAGTDISQVTLGIDSTLTVAHSGALADAEISLLGAELTFAADGAYGNAIRFVGPSQITAAAGKTVALTGTLSDGAAAELVGFAAKAGATLTLDDSVLDLENTRVYLGENVLDEVPTIGKIVVNVESDNALTGAVANSTNYEGKVQLRGAGTAEFNVAEGATLSVSDIIGEIGEFAVTGAGTVSFASGASLSVAFGGAGTLSVAESATLKLTESALSGFTLTGAGTTTISGGSLGGMKDATNVSLSSGTLTVSGDVSGSAVRFSSSSAKLATSSSSSAGASVTATTLSGATVTLVNAGGSVNYSSDSSFSGTTNLVLEAEKSDIIGGVVNAAYAGSLTKNGDGTWTVADYTLGDAAGESLAVNGAGTLIWENAKFGENMDSASVSIAKDATLRIVGLDEGDTLGGLVSGSGTLQIYGTGTAENPLMLDVDADADSAWRLRVSGGSQVLITSALPGALLLEDSGTVAVVELSGSDEMMTMTERLFIASGATLEKTGAGTLIIDASSSVHQVSGTVSVSDGEFIQRTNMTWSSGARLVVSGDGVFETDFSSADRLRNNASVSGDGTLNFTKTGDAGYEFYGDVSGFTGAANIAENASLTLSGSLFDKSARVDIASGGELTIAVSSKTVGERALENLSGAGTLVIDTPRDSNIYTAVYDYDADNAFSGIIYVRSGVFSMDTDGLSGLAAEKVVVGGNASAVYNETKNASGILSGGFLRLVNGGESVYDATALLTSSSSKFSLESAGGVIFAGGTHAVGGDFGTGGLFVTEAGATLRISGSAEVSGGVFVASSSVLDVNAPEQTRSVSGSKAFSAASEAGNVKIVGGDFTLNGTLRVHVDDSTDMDSALVGVSGVDGVGGNTVLNTSGAAEASIEIIGDVSGEELTGVTVLGGKNTQTGDLADLVSVVTSGGETLSVTRDENGSLVVVSSSLDEYSPSSGLSELYSVLAGNPDSALWKSYLKNDLANRDLTAERLVKLSPVSFGALVEMQSGFAAIENDLLRERLEQRRYERTFAADRGVQFKPFVNVVGSSRDGDGDGTESANYDITHFGAIGGFDFSVSDNTILGVSVGLDWAKADLHSGAGKHEADSSRIGVYGMSVFENAYFGWGLSAGATSFETKRHSGFNGETLTGDTDGNDVNASFIFGAGWTLDEALGIDVSPYVGLDVGYAYAKSFSEDGGSETALDVDRIDRWSLRGKIGATLNWRATDSLRVGIDAAFTHEFLDSDIDIDAEFASGDLAGSAFSSTAYLMDENTIQIGPRADFRINDAWSLSAAYTFETDLDDTMTHTANLGVRARF